MIALDAVDPDLAISWAEQLPNLRRLFEQSTRAEVRNPYGLISALWISFATGLTPRRHGFHCWEVVDPTSYERLMITPSWTAQRPFWRSISDAGRRVAVIDVPHSKVIGPLNGVEIVEWGSHDRHFGLHSWPPEKSAEIVSHFGTHPIFGHDAFAVRDFAPDDEAHRRGRIRTAAEERALLADLRRGLDAKKRMMKSLLAEEKWDLFLGSFAEAHAVGHQAWHLHDPAHHRYDPASPAATDGDPLLQSYRETDAAIGELLEDLDENATVVVLMSHGMASHYNGMHLLEEVLARLDRAENGDPPLRPIEDGLKRILRPIVPWLQFLADRLHLSSGLRGRLGRRVAITTYATPDVRARQRYFLGPNNFLFGGVRINMAGRESEGRVDPADFDRVCDSLREDLLALVNVETGGPVIRSVERIDLHHIRHSGDTLPDLVISWERSAPIETVASPKIGTLHVPDPNSRTGDHKPDGLLLARGPGLSGGGCNPAIRIEDIGPSIAARLGVRLEDVDGSVIPWLAGTDESRAPDERTEIVSPA